MTCLRFTPDGSHLISASEDGSINIYKVGSWFLEKTWTKAHKGMGNGSSLKYISGVMIGTICCCNIFIIILICQGVLSLSLGSNQKILRLSIFF